MGIRMGSGLFGIVVMVPRVSGMTSREGAMSYLPGPGFQVFRRNWGNLVG